MTKENILLIGYRGSGKSTVGKLLAQELNWTWVDSDDEIEREVGKTIAQIFAEDGEPAFRHWESIVVARLVASVHCVISLGGGALLREQNRTALRGRGTIVWLKASIDSIRHRIEKDVLTAQRRPQLTGQGLQAETEQVLAERTPVYEQCCHICVDTDQRTPLQIVQEIRRRLNL